jgi:RecB family exonuclease
VRFPGYRQRLLDRFNGWTRAEWPLDGPSPDVSPVGLEEFVIFGHYRATLYDLGAEDAEGWSVWMSKALIRQPPPELRKLGQVVVIDPVAPRKAEWRLLDHCSKKARAIVVTLPFDPDPSLSDLYASIEPTRNRLIQAGFVEEPEPPDFLTFGRPKGLEAVERELFQNDSSPKIRSADGLKILGGPKGNGVALLVAREVSQALDRGVEPEEIVILASRLDTDTERIRETLVSWGMPVDRGKPRPLAAIPAISALRLAMRLPVDGWESASLTRLLRNGQVRWSQLVTGGPLDPFEAASSIQMTRVFRDCDALINALRRAIDDPNSRNFRAKMALRVVEPLAKAIDSVVGSAPWNAQVDRLRGLAGLLGIDAAALEPLWDALDDQSWVRERLGAPIDREVWSWSRFVGQVDATVHAIEIPRPPVEPGTIRIESVSTSEGVRARLVILTNLAERTFPSAEAIDLDATVDRVSPAYAREMLRFARVAGSAEENLILAFPTSDPKGEKLLPAGFLDDLIRRLDPDNAAACVEKHSRFDPVLIGHADLARSPSDAQVLAVALACQKGDFSRLQSLARIPEHSEALRGAANAFDTAHHRRQESAFGPYDGRLRDPRAIAAIRSKFGPDHTFSPSQLESFALCPFQFYQRYVLGLKLVDERQELDEDYAGRGEDVHRVLEQIHLHARDEGSSNLIERLNVLIETQMRVDLEQHDGRPVDVASILKEIGTRRTNKALGRYVGQFRGYALKAGAGAIPHRFEVEFGRRDESDETSVSLPHLTIGEGETSLKLEGKIDRIDLVQVDGKLHFRVIDYKTGSNPSSREVHSGLASQLPLYAMAVERLVFPEGSHALADFGYWKLRDDGFKEVKLKDDWETYREHLMDFVLRLVAQIRQGTFPIHSMKPDCRSHCDYKAACRVGEVRSVHKTWDDRPILGAGE